MKTIKIHFLLLVYLFLALKSVAQINAASIQQLVSSENNLTAMGVRYPALVKDFYISNQYQPVWISSNNLSLRQTLYNYLSAAEDLGLDEKDYQYRQIQSIKSNTPSLQNEMDSIKAEVLLTDAAIHFFSEVQYGNTAPALRYNGLNYKPAIDNIPFKLTRSIMEGKLSSLAFELEPKSMEYNALKQRLLYFNKVLEGDQFKEVTITSNKGNKTNTFLIVKLYQLGLLNFVDTGITDKALVQKIRGAQQLFNLMSDGTLRNTTLQVLNVPLAKRKEELKQALNFIRWLHPVKQTQSAIFVNIPSASLFLYTRGKMILDSRVIVGKNATPTPTLSSKVTEVILYPYWMVPNKIAVRELLPLIKRNIAYLEQNNFQVLSKQGRVLNPYSINWSSLSAGYFPYIIRQSTGCDNSLGIIKLNFYNPFTVYLHDTPAKSLFLLNKRYFSHGCMRVEKALELARLVLKDNRIAVDTITEKGCLRSQAPIVVPVKEPINVFVLYSTAWYDRNGQITFYDDVYEKNYFVYRD